MTDRHSQALHIWPLRWTSNKHTLQAPGKNITTLVRYVQVLRPAGGSSTTKLCPQFTAYTNKQTNVNIQTLAPFLVTLSVPQILRTFRRMGTVNSTHPHLPHCATLANSKITDLDMVHIQDKKLSCRRETARYFVSLNILLRHSRSFEMTQLSRACVSPC